MGFHLIDMENWERREYYEHYINEVVCTYSLTVDLDISGLEGQRLYPAMLWLLTDTVNEMQAFRTALSPAGVGIYDSMHPSYTIFNKEQKNFSVIWTAFEKDYSAFLRAYEEDVGQYSSSLCFSPKKGKPDNTFDISMLPWAKFTSFNINVYDEGKYLLPIFTMGKIFTQNNHKMLPLAIQAHHAVCDGYHVGMFIERLQEKITFFPESSAKKSRTNSQSDDSYDTDSYHQTVIK